MLEQLIHKEAIAFEAVAVQSWTRESFVAWMTTPFSIPFWFCGGIIYKRKATYLNDRKADSKF
jgi:6-phosphofructokinase 2